MNSDLLFGTFFQNQTDYRIGSIKAPGLYFSKWIFDPRLHKKGIKIGFSMTSEGWGFTQEWGFNGANTVVLFYIW